MRHKSNPNNEGVYPLVDHLTVAIAERIARAAHDGAYRRDGVTPYIEHVEDAQRRVDRDSFLLRAALWLHDVLEDTEFTSVMLLDSGIPQVVVDVVEVLTHRDESYTEYILRIAQHDVARQAKIADILSNLSDSPTPKQVSKYARALTILLGEEVYHLKRHD